MQKLEQLALRMVEFDAGDAKRIQHFLKVHSFAHLICVGEGVPEHTRLLTEAAALVHDIGIHAAEAKYGRCDGKLQEQEGPAPAAALLRETGFDEADVQRICYLVAHHHTYDAVDGPDYRILLEADFLVNAYEDALPVGAVRTARERIFETATGTRLLNTMLAL